MQALRSRIRQPLIWMILAEVVLVVAFLLVAWRLWDDRQRTAAGPRPTLPSHGPPRSSRSPAVGATQPVIAPTPAPRAPVPGVSSDPAFMARQMQGLNQETSAIEGVEWEAARTVMQWTRWYLDHVVLPAVERAEKADRRVDGR
jgi:hypothetical protein